MVIVSAFGFLFPISYRHFKIWQKLKFEITFDFTEKKFFDFVTYLYYEKKWLIDSHMIRHISCRLYPYICIMYVFLFTFQTPESTLPFVKRQIAKWKYTIHQLIMDNICDCLNFAPFASGSELDFNLPKEELSFISLLCLLFDIIHSSLPIRKFHQ